MEYIIIGILSAALAYQIYKRRKAEKLADAMMDEALSATVKLRKFKESDDHLMGRLTHADFVSITYSDGTCRTFRLESSVAVDDDWAEEIG